MASRRQNTSRLHSPSKCVCPKCGGWKCEKARQCQKCRFVGVKPVFNRTRDVITAIANGKCLKEIAHDWQISIKTVESHWKSAREKYHISNISDAVKLAIKARWISI